MPQNLDTFSNRKHVHVWNFWTGRVQQEPLRSAFGRNNLYKSLAGEHDVELLFAKLEKATGDVIKKIKDAMEHDDDKNITSKEVQLSDIEIRTMRKFICISGWRNKGVGNHYSDERTGVHQGPPNLERTNGQHDTNPGQEYWLRSLRHMLETSHQDLLETSELDARESQADPAELIALSSMMA